MNRKKKQRRVVRVQFWKEAGPALRCESWQRAPCNPDVPHTRTTVPYLPLAAGTSGSFQLKGAMAATLKPTTQRIARAADDRTWGTADLTLTVTWFSRICRDTDRIGSLASRRDCTLKSFIYPPAHSTGWLFWDTLRRPPGLVKRQPQHLVVRADRSTTSCGSVDSAMG